MNSNRQRQAKTIFTYTLMLGWKASRWNWLPFYALYTQALYVPLSTLTIQEGRQQKIRIPNLLIAYVPICASTVRSQLVDGTLAHLPTPPQSSDSGVTHLSYIVYEMRTTLKEV